MPTDNENTISAPSETEPSDPSRRTLLAGSAGLGLAAAVPAATAAAQSAETRSREFAGRSAFITGGARGIGYATAEALARSGADIMLYDVAGQIEHVKYPLATPEDLAKAKANIEALGVKCIAVQGDVRDGAKQKAAMQEAVSTFGSVDFVIANAGITQVGPLDIFSEAEIDVVLDVNLAGAMKTLQAAIPIMRAQNAGRIVLMSSITGRRGSEFFPVYSASKWGMIGLAKSTARLLAKSNVTCNAVCPSLVRTKLLDNDYILGTMIPDNPTIEAADAGAKQLHVMPVGLYGPEHVANTVTFICSDAAAYISGDVFDIAAGRNTEFPA
ncbi:MAG: SDR family NAD(P)-dependent oxidoreductase [Minwuiales bacterium]|nr:SDR family NAD(P)-dependent oxidoreductase [Minwuiales bacterium]